MKLKTEIANKFYNAFKRTGNPYFYILAVDAEKTASIRQTVLQNQESELTL